MYTTRVAREGGVNPTWGDKFDLSKVIDKSFFYNKNSYIYLQLCTNRSLLSPRFLGWCAIPARDIVDGFSQVGTARQLSYRLRNKDGSRGHGFVNVMMKLESSIFEGPKRVIEPDVRRLPEMSYGRVAIGVPVKMSSEGKANETKDPIEKKVVKVIMLDSSKPLLEYVGGAKAVFAKYVGGLWVVIEFQTTSARNSFLNHKGMHNWLSRVIPWLRSFVPRERLIWLNIEGIPLVAWSLDSLKRVAKNWGEVVYLDEEQEDNYYSAKVCVESQFSDFIMESVEVNVEGKRYGVRVKKVTGWIPSFKNEEHKRESEEVNQPQAFEKQGKGDDDSKEDMDDEFIADTFAKEEEDDNMKENYDPGDIQNEWGSNKDDRVDEVNDIRNTNDKEHGADKSNPDFPPGFTPTVATTTVENDQLDEASPINQQNERERWRTTSGGENYNEKSENVVDSFRFSQPNNVVGFSILNRLKEAIQLGKALGIDMDGCADDMEKLINGIRAKGMQETKMSRMDLVMVRMVWGNSRFDFASSSAKGLSGDILCVWDPKMFVKNQIVSHDHFVTVEGVWNISNLRMQFITVYAPQDANAIFLLWYSLQILISRFNGESIIIGDFNVVRVPEERMGSGFNINMAESFNNFIMENDLVDVSLGGYQFTWVNSLATKMSKIDRPILLKEAKADYGPIPFCFFHSWLDCDGFDELVVNSWSMPCVGDSNLIVVSQATMLPQAFHTMTIQEPAWNMDTGASYHLADNTCILTSVCNQRLPDRRLLLRCDSMRDLYPVTQQPSSQTPVVLLSFSSTTWHRRLGKHAKLPFYNSESFVDSVFEIIHSDIWTSPIPSESGIKYYAIFLDHFSHFVWVYPLHKKADLFDNFVVFRAYVNKQFNVDIKALQCDHGGEYDNTRFHDLFRQNGIQFRVEAEYRGVAETAWIRNLLCELHTPLFTATLVYCDNVSAVYMSANPVQHQRTKHIEINIHFVRDFVASGQVRVLHVPSRFQYADIFTKGLPTALFIEFRSSLNIRRSPAHTEGEY
ncbi:RNA-directed DNA polymerase, eukaryota [Tanacetum coccineum]